MANFWDDLGDFVGWGSARRQREFEANQAQLNRDWQTMMSNTAHQREVADLKEAGLNPVLSVTGGGTGATTPSGAMPSSAQAQAQLPNLINSTSNMIQTIHNTQNQQKNRDAITSAVKLISMLAKFT